MSAAVSPQSDRKLPGLQRCAVPSRPPTWRLTLCACVALVVLAVAIRAGVVMHAVLDPDESEHLNAAWLVGQGHVPYRDFWDHHMPFFYYVFAPVTWWSGERPLVYFLARAVMSLTAGATLLLVYRLARRVSPTVALAAVGLLAILPRFVEKTTEVRPDVPALVAWLGAMLALVRWREQGRPVWLWGAGFALGVATAFNLKTVYGGLGALAAAALASAAAGPGASRRVLGASGRLIGGFVVVPAGMAAWLWLTGGVSAIVAFVVEVGGANLRFVDFGMQWPVDHAGLGFLGLALGGLGLTLRRERWGVLTHPAHGPLVVPLLTISIILALPTTPGVAKHAWLPVLAGLAIYAGIAIAALLETSAAAGPRLRWPLLWAALVVGVGVPAGHGVQSALHRANDEQQRVMRLELTETCPGEPVLDGTVLAVFRPPAHRYRTLISGVRLWIARGAVSEAVLIDDLTRTRPRVAYPDVRVRAVVGMYDFVKRHYVAQPDGLWRLGARVAVSAGSGPSQAAVELLAPGWYRLVSSPGLTIAIDGTLAPARLIHLTAGPHVVSSMGSAGTITLIAATCAERLAMGRPSGAVD